MYQGDTKITWPADVGQGYSAPFARGLLYAVPFSLAAWALVIMLILL